MMSRNKPTLNKQYVIMVSFRNPYTADGGTEKYIIQMTELYEKAETDVIVIFPLDLRKVYGIGWIHGWGIVENRSFIGIKQLNTIIDIVNSYNQEKTCVGVIIHNIIFMDLDELYSILSFRASIALYIHDYSSCCVQETLRKNDRQYCGDAKIYNKKCSDCCYFDKAKEKHEAVELFINRFSHVRIIAPSETAANLWADSYPAFADKVEIIPHLIPNIEQVNIPEEISDNDIIRIAFVGAATSSKGWDRFIGALHVVATNNDSAAKKMMWYYFGHSRIQEDNIQVIDIQLLKNGDSPMTEALKKNDIDSVVLFSDWPETYSYTYYESIAANCFVITNENSGNIAAEVLHNETGIVLPNTVDALISFLSDRYAIAECINKFRKKYPYSVSSYKNNIQIIYDPENIQQKQDNTNTIYSSGIKAFIANVLYRIAYSSFIGKHLPVAYAPKASMDRMLRFFNRHNR